ncbi:flavoprotein [Shigella boydii]|uniref:CoA-transferase n=1 Tax=Shigella boydii TaxID=621 RepID=UPI000E5C9CFD|nr:CoA-transferase [Shigella boydii]RIG41811.1 flavoprotein [Shigella boydii]
MKPVKPPRINGRVPVLSAQEAVNYIPDEATLCVLGAGGGILEATTLITALADKYKQTQTPRNLSIISPTGLGDRADRGISPLAQEGLVKWALCGHWGQSPRISDLAEQNKIIAYNYPQGVLTQTLRAAAAHQSGIISDIGIGTFVDPRQQGGKLLEYSAHMVPEGGLAMVPQLVNEGVMIVGDAAGFCLNLGFTVRGMDLAIASAQAAATTVIAAKERADFSASSLAQYKRELEQSCVMRDMQHFRKIPALMENPRLFSQYPRMVADIMNEMFTIDGKPNQPVRKMIMGHAKKIGLINLLKDGIKGATAL